MINEGIVVAYKCRSCGHFQKIASQAENGVWVGDQGPGMLQPDGTKKYPREIPCSKCGSHDTEMIEN